MHGFCEREGDHFLELVPPICAWKGSRETLTRDVSVKTHASCPLSAVLRLLITVPRHGLLHFCDDKRGCEKEKKTNRILVCTCFFSSFFYSTFLSGSFSGERVGYKVCRRAKCSVCGGAAIALSDVCKAFFKLSGCSCNFACVSVVVECRHRFPYIGRLVAPPYANVDPLTNFVSSGLFFGTSVIYADVFVSLPMDVSLYNYFPRPTFLYFFIQLL